MLTLVALYAFSFAFGMAVFAPRERKPKRIYYRHDESLAPLAPRSGVVKNPTLRQIRENDLPRYIGEDGRVHTVQQDENGEWV